MHGQDTLDEIEYGDLGTGQTALEPVSYTHLTLPTKA